MAVPPEKEGRKIDPFSTLADRVEAFEERAAIIEFEGGASRRSAEAQAEKLLGILARREAWSPSDLEDGRDAITRNPEDAAALFLEMLGRLSEDTDNRVRCVDCKHFRYGKCFEFRKAGLTSNEVGHDLATIPQRCAAFVHGPGPYRPPVHRVNGAPAEHLRSGWESFRKVKEWIRPYLGTLEANGWSDDDLMRLPTNRAGTGAGVVWTLAVFKLSDLEVTRDFIVAVTTEGNRMTLRR